MVEEAVYKEFDALAERGGVLGAMETMYQRSKIQEESLHYEQRKHDGSLPLIGVNTFLAPQSDRVSREGPALIRSSDAEKDAQVAAVHCFQQQHAAQAPAALERLRTVAASQGNVFAELIEAVKVCSLGQISQALYDAGGRYRRNV
jgi:methylmalonyl-CoA mutase